MKSFADALTVCALLALFTKPVLAQTRPVLPRDVEDTTYSLRLAINDMQEALQTGDRPRTLLLDSDLVNEGRALRQARIRANRPRPSAHANALWDLRLEVEDVRPTGPNRWVAYVTMSLGQDSITTTNMALLFRQTTKGWLLEDKRALLTLLAGMLRSVNKRSAS